MAAPSTVGSINYFFRTVVYGGIVALLAFSGWQVRGLLQRHEQELAARDQRIQGLQADVARRDEKIAAQAQEIEQLQARVAELELALRLMKVDHRLARLTVTAQRPAPGQPGGLATEVAFQELDSEGQPLGAEQRFTLAGKVAYVDALVIKFDDSFVEGGDALRGSSICFFRRLFGEYQWPSEGFPIDSVGTRPRSYGAGDDAQPLLETSLWKRFWDYANDPAAAAKLGVRALHGEAPYMELREGRSYRVELRASGGLSVAVEE